jgi:hypothetical protein
VSIVLIMYGANCIKNDEVVEGSAVISIGLVCISTVLLLLLLAQMYDDTT